MESRTNQTQLFPFFVLALLMEFEYDVFFYVSDDVNDGYGLYENVSYDLLNFHFYSLMFSHSEGN